MLHKKKKEIVTGYQKDFVDMEIIYPNSSLGRLVTVVKLSPKIKLDRLVRIINLLPNSLVGLNYFYDRTNNEFEFKRLGEQETKIKEYDEYKAIISAIENTYRGLTFRDKMYDIFIARTPEASYLAIYVSHLICDASGIMKINDKIFEYYHDEQRMEEPVPSLFIKDYQKYASSSKYLKDEEFWENQIDELTKNECYRKNSLSIASFRRCSVIPEEIEAQIVKVCEMYSISKSLLVSSFFCLLKMKETGITTSVIGSPISTKRKKDQELLGHYANILPFKMVVTEETFAKQIDSWKSEWFKILRHAHYPLVEINKQVFQKGKKSEYIDCLVNYIYAEFTEELKKSVCSDVVWEANEELVFPLKITISNRSQPLLEIDAKQELFTSKEVVEVEEEFYKFINKLASQAEWTLSELMAFDTKDIFSLEVELADVFKRNSEKTCLITEKKELSYAQLFQESNKVFNKLKELKITRQSVIGVYMDRGETIIATMLGIIRAGCVFLPLSVEMPDARLEYIIADASPTVIISDEESVSDMIMKENRPIILYETLKERMSSDKYFDIQSILKTDLLYIIYTSGTTGNPKGVTTTRKNLESLFEACFLEYKFTKSDTWIQLHANTFDFSIWEIFGALLNGAKLVIPKKETLLNKEKLATIIKEHGVNILNITPQAFYHLIGKNKSLNKNCFRYVIFGGDKLDFTKIKSFYDQNSSTEIYNMYGITEITVHASIKKINDTDFKHQTSNIGRPLQSLKIFLIKEDGRLCQKGEVGEIVVVGEGVAKGYLGNIAETKKKFKSLMIDDTYFRAYYTGDSARYLENGEIEYIDRMDSIVNIRGFRVGLEEINQMLSREKHISNVYTMVYRDNAREDLISIIESDLLTSDLDAQRLKQSLEAVFPHYMIPNQLVFIDKIPMNINGKVDKEKLNERFGDKKETSLISSNNNLAQQVEQIWKEILRTTNYVDKQVDFFDAGGDSIKSIQFLSELEDIGIFIESNDFLKTPTLAYCLSKVETKSPSYGKEQEDNTVENAQSFLPLISNYVMTSESSVNYIQSVAIDVPMDVSLDLVSELIESMQKEFDTFRVMNINVKANCMMFSNQLTKNYDIIDWGKVSEKEESTILKKINEEGLTSFSEEVVIRVDRLKKQNGTKLVFMVSHFLIDGFSWKILFKFIEAYLFENNSSDGFNTRKDQSYRKWLSNEYQQINLESLVNKTKNQSIEHAYVDTETCYFKHEHDKNIGTQQMEQIYLTALASACFQHIPEYSAELLIEKETHNRKKENAKMIGWFTRMCELTITNSSADLEELFQQVANENNQKSKQSEDEFIKNYIEERNKKRAIRFNYLTSLELDNCDKLTISDIFFEHLADSSQVFKNEFEINIVPQNGEVTVQIRYLKKHESILKQFEQTFLDNILHLMKQNQELERPKMEYLGGKNKNKLILVPPSMPYFGYSIIYKKIAQLFCDQYEVYMLTHFKSENILNEFIDLSKKIVTDNVTLMGYSFGGTIAVEIARALKKSGIMIEQVVLFDSFLVKKNRFDELEMDEEETLEFLIKDFIRKKSGKEAQTYNDNMLTELIKDYKTYHYAIRDIYTKREAMDIDIMNFVTENEVGWNGERREGWSELCERYVEISIVGEHTEIFDAKYFEKNAEIIKKNFNSVANLVRGNEK